VGEANIGARVLVDDREAGYAPNKLQVALGHHRIEVVRTDGTRLSAQVDVTEYATIAHPVRPAM
jgi:hypothetical protein